MSIKLTPLNFDSIKTIDKIYHFADIHIRNVKRHEEYREVFEKLYANLDADDLTNSIAVLAGDLVHGKLEISPELIHEASDFLSNIANRLPLIIITGNHDANLNNQARLDTLTPIVNNLNHANIRYLKNSGVYSGSDNCIFTVMSVFETPDKYIRGNQIKTNKTKIALYHGPVHNAKTDIGYVVSNKSMPTEIFSGYDIAMLGDIHKTQVFKQKNTIIKYPGSLIQQNYGEDISGHGYTVWDLKTKDHQHVEIPNDYGFFTIEVKDGKLETDVSDMPSKARLRVKCFETIPTEVKKIISKIRKKHNITDLTFVNSSYFTNKASVDTDKIKFEDIASVEYQNTLIKDYVNKNFVLEPEVVDEIMRINKELNSTLSREDIVKNVRWNLKRLEWDNLFSYGEDNVIDFTKTKNILGLFGKNTAGKTSAIDILTFALFDKCSRAFKATEMINTSKMTFSVKCVFEIDGVDYYITKKGSKDKKGYVKVDVNFYKLDNSGEEISLNGEQRRDTNSVIRDYVGTYDDFILTTLSQQGNSSNFIDKGQSDKKDLLAQFLGINVFDKLYNKAIEANKEVAIMMRTLNKAEFTKTLVDAENNLLVCRNNLKIATASKDVLQSEIDTINAELMSLNQKLQDIDGEVSTNIEADEADIEEHRSVLDSLVGKIKIKQSELEEKQKSLDVYDAELNSFTLDAVLSNVELYEDACSSKNDIQKKLDRLKLDIKLKEEKLSKLAEHKYDPNCQFCINNVFVKDAIATKELLKKDKVLEQQLESDVAEENDLVNKLKYHKTTHDNLIKTKSLRDSVYTAVLELKNSIGSLENNKNKKQAIIDDLERGIARAQENEKIIENNRLVTLDISDLKKNHSAKRLELDKVTKSIISLSSQEISMDGKIKDLEVGIKNAEELEFKYNAYNFYIEAIKRDGVPYQIISETIPSIENEINNILSQIVEFGIILHMDGKNINANIVYEDKCWPLEMTSGMEKFISSIALRVALTNISNLPKPNTLIIDEGMGALDADTLSSMYSLFAYLKTQFDFVIVISHLESIKDMVDGFIEIKKENGFSSIQYV